MGIGLREGETSTAILVVTGFAHGSSIATADVDTEPLLPSLRSWLNVLVDFSASE